MTRLPKSGKEDKRSELKTMIISKQLGCREKKKTDLCEKKKKTCVNLEARMPCDNKREDYQKEKILEDNQKENNTKQRNIDALSPPTIDARKGNFKKHLRLSKPNGEPSKLNKGKVSKLLKVFERNEDDIKAKQLTRIFSGFHMLAKEKKLIGQKWSTSEVESHGRGGQQSPLN